ncbi:hypothetical protein BKA62DRAFT_753769 [Auriculariales sp. MPI-PUGE-AT-0066]|nr:hypothetical protein BKA62DRAFT_753769 [Auriculariales sp. MPI-PUGE-AT-0066]
MHHLPSLPATPMMSNHLPPQSTNESKTVTEPGAVAATDTTNGNNAPVDADQTVEPPSDALKREYLSLLDKDRLVDLLLAYDDDPINAPPIFPDTDLQDAIDALRAGSTKLDNGGVEIPSYEDMIAQAIAEIADPDGTFPKVLFQWMDQNYPLQANFRPSASQALQRAYKRGRLDKLQSGRYILNPKWEGGPASKRATRRPKTMKPEAPVTTFRSQAMAGSSRVTNGNAVQPPTAPPTTSSGRPQRAAAQKTRQQIHDTIMRDESPIRSPPRPFRTSTAPVVKTEDVEMDRPDMREPVHSMLVTLSKQLAALQAERRKKKPR